MKNNIKVHRAIHNITQVELAAKVKVSAWTISQLELNRYVPSAALAVRIARLFNTPMEEIFLFEDDE